LQNALGSLGLSADIDVRGVEFTAELLERLLAALRDPGTGVARIGTAGFRNASFAEGAIFDGVEFEGKAVFTDSSFSGPARFKDARFGDRVWFEGAKFCGMAVFNGASFSSDAFFSRAHFSLIAWFQNTGFNANAWFSEAHFNGMKISESDRHPRSADFSDTQFSGVTEFQNVRFGGDARFSRAHFHHGPLISGVQVDGDLDFTQAQFADCDRLGPAAVAGALQLSRARFDRVTQVEAAAAGVFCPHAIFGEHATLLLRYAQVMLDDVIVGGPLTIAAAESLNPLGQSTPLDEALISRPPDEARPRLLSLAGVDCSELVITDADLSSCHFAGALHLDQLRLEGNCRFASSPRGWTLAWHWPPRLRWTRRQILAEESSWRASQPVAPGWPPPDSPFTPPRPQLQPERLAALYRQLRKAQEDSKNEPGAADFYYGEMEMRRHAPTASSGERTLLFLYWLTAGYALRATRALTFLGALIITATALLTLCGLAGPSTHYALPARLNQAALITLNAIAFRATGQPLTTPGAYIEMAARFIGPALLAPSHPRPAKPR
jgi:uncharacterized protein YjbI with pentapeptide repeats